MRIAPSGISKQKSQRQMPLAFSFYNCADNRRIVICCLAETNRSQRATINSNFAIVTSTLTGTDQFNR